MGVCPFAHSHYNSEGLPTSTLNEARKGRARVAPVLKYGPHNYGLSSHLFLHIRVSPSSATFFLKDGQKIRDATARPGLKSCLDMLLVLFSFGALAVSV